MEVEENYPIKFALLEIRKKDITKVGFEDENLFEPIAYIVSKVYVVSERKKYVLANGKRKYEMEYGVVYPYNRRNHFTEKRVKPECIEDNECYNSDIVSEIFETYEEAKQEADKKNKSLGNNYIKKIKGLERIIEEQTTDMIPEIEREKNKYKIKAKNNVLYV